MISQNAFIGSRISLVTCSDIRYEGKLIGVDMKNHTVTLADVRVLGAEERRKLGAMASSGELHAYIVFRGADVKDLTVTEVKKNDVQVKAPPRARLGNTRRNEDLASELSTTRIAEIKLDFDFVKANSSLEKPKERKTGPGYVPSMSFFDTITYGGVRRPNPRRAGTSNKTQSFRAARGRYVRKSRN